MGCMQVNECENATEGFAHECDYGVEACNWCCWLGMCSEPFLYPPFVPVVGDPRICYHCGTGEDGIPECDDEQQPRTCLGEDEVSMTIISESTSLHNIN